jgi:hypothetical protein
VHLLASDIGNSLFGSVAPEVSNNTKFSNSNNKARYTIQNNSNKNNNGYVLSKIYKNNSTLNASTIRPSTVFLIERNSLKPNRNSY